MSVDEIVMIINILASSVISLQIIFFSKRNLKHKIGIAFIAWGCVTYFASIPIRTLLGQYDHHFFCALINLLIAFLMIIVRGNVSIVIKMIKCFIIETKKKSTETKC